jgi:aspartyl-tRNA(Asn)/glutamyl-tRNA(Gln) amidotransferase subunit A
MFFSISQIQKLLFSNKCSLKNVVDFYLKNIKLNEHLNAFLEVFENEAFERALAIEEKNKKSHCR